VLLRGRAYEPWLRLIALATLAQHAVGLFYVPTPRYALLAWLLTFVVVAAWARADALPWLRRRAPDFTARIAGHALARRMDGGLAALERRLGLASP
jgi:hypothetical protein